MSVGRSNLNHLGEVTLRSPKTHSFSMDSDTQENKTYSAQGDRIPQSVAYGSDIVPVGPTSSSNYGLSPMLPPSIGLENVIDESEVAGSSELATASEIAQKEAIQAPIKTPGDGIQISSKTPGDGDIPPKDNETINNSIGRGVEEADKDETAPIKSTCIAMECEDFRVAKRKKSHSAHRSLSEDSEEELMKRAKVTRRQRFINESDLTPLAKGKGIQSRSNLDISQNTAEEEHRSMKKKREYKAKKEIEETQEEREERREYDRPRRKEERAIIEKEKKKKEEKIKAETKVIGMIGTMDVIEKDLIESMTASDLASRALECLDHVEVIRTKCGTMQGALSGELKKRKLSLDDMVRALQVKAEEKGDPHFLKAKIDELINKNRLEEEKKNKEINELRETVADLTRQNKEMRKELRFIREILKKKNERCLSEERSAKKESHLKDSYQGNIDRDSKEKEENLPVNTYRKRYNNEETHLLESSDASEDPRSQDVQRRPKRSKDDEEGPVMRPPLGGKSAPIPNSNLQQKEKVHRVMEKMERGKGKPVIKVIENRQIKPPRKERQKAIKAKENEDEDFMVEDMDIEEMEIEIMDNERNQERSERNQVRSEERMGRNLGRTEMKTDNKTKEMTWTEVGRRGKVKKEKKSTQEKGKQTPKEKKRKLPKTAAVSIKGDEKQGFSYAEVLRKARSQINIEDLQIEAPKIRKGLNGATIIEISGPDCNTKAKKLADKLQEVLKEDKAAVTTPKIKGELRITGLDESIGKEEIGWAIEEGSGCGRKDIRIGEIRRNRRGMGVVWVQCPLKTAIEVANRKKIKVGWTIVGVTLLQARPLQCYRCWHYGHVKDQCRSKVDRSQCCF